TEVVGSSAVVGSVTADNTSQVTRTRATPSSAIARLSATTAATGSPCQDALPTASGRCIADFMPWKCARGATQPEHTENLAPPGQRGAHAVASDSRGHPGQRRRLGSVEGHDAGVRVGTPQEGDVEEARKDDVVGEDAAAREEASRLRTHHALADITPARLDAA